MSILIFIRSVFRIIEYLQGSSDPLQWILMSDLPSCRLYRFPLDQGGLPLYLRRRPDVPRLLHS